MSEWKKVKLGDISLDIQTGPFGSQLHQSDYSKEGIPVVMPKDMEGGIVKTDSIARVEEHHAKRLSRYKISEGDILYARRGDVGKCVYTTKDQNGWLCGTGCLRVTINKELASPKFIFFQLQKRETVGWVEKHAVGATMLNLNTSILGDVPVEYPSLSEQNRIVDILSRYDSLIENYQKQIKLLEEAAQRLYKEWFVDLRFPGYEKVKVVDGVPEGWERKKLGELVYDAGIKINKNDRCSYECYLPIDCLPKKQMTYFVSNSIEQAESSLISFSKGDIIFGAMRPYFHKVCIARHNGITRSTCFVLKEQKAEYKAYSRMLLFDEDSVNYATSISVGTTMPYVRWNDFKQMAVVVPTKIIADKFNSVVNEAIENCGILASQIRNLTESRDRMLVKLMSGEVEV